MTKNSVETLHVLAKMLWNLCLQKSELQVFVWTIVRNSHFFSVANYWLNFSVGYTCNRSLHTLLLDCGLVILCAAPGRSRPLTPKNNIEYDLIIRRLGDGWYWALCQTDSNSEG